MHIVLGGTGHVGSAVATALLSRGEAVTVVTRDPGKGAVLSHKGASVAKADIGDPDGLRRIFESGESLFLLNPPAPPASDTDAQERRTATSILEALDGSGLQRIVALSTYGARKGSRIGDLGTLFDLEEGLRNQSIPTAILRAAYYMTNWDMAFESAAREGIVRTVFPADFVLPMVAPSDLGEAIAGLMTREPPPTGIHHAEGPETYTSRDVATAFAEALRKPVRTEAVPRENWNETFRSLGFSNAAAASYAGMTALAVDGEPENPAAPFRGSVTLRDYITELVHREGGKR